MFVVPDGERAAVFDEALRLLRSALEGDDVAFDGDYFTVSSVAVQPLPAQAARHLARGDRRRRVSGASAHSVTAGWAASSHPMRRATAVNRSNGRRSVPAAQIEPDHFGINLAVCDGGCPTSSPLRSVAADPILIPTEFISDGWSRLHRRLDAYLEAGLSKFVIRPVGPAPPTGISPTGLWMNFSRGRTDVGG